MNLREALDLISVGLPQALRRTEAIEVVASRIEALEVLAEKLRTCGLALQLGLTESKEVVPPERASDRLGRAPALGAPVTGPASSDSTSAAPGPSAASGGRKCSYCYGQGKRYYRNVPGQPKCDKCHGTGDAPEAKGDDVEFGPNAECLLRFEQSKAANKLRTELSVGRRALLQLLDYDPNSGEPLAELIEHVGQDKQYVVKERDAARSESASQRVRAVKAEEALQTSRALCDKLRESATAWRGKYYAAAARVEQLEPLIASERAAKEKLARAEAKIALADEVARQVRRWAKYCEDNKFQMYGDLPMLYAIEKYEAYDAALKPGDGDGGK